MFRPVNALCKANSIVHHASKSASAAAASSAARGSWWDGVEQGPLDPIMGMAQRFAAEKNPSKVNLGIGAYRDDQGKPYVLNAVRKAEQSIVEAKMDKEYAGIVGIPAFNEQAAILALGKNCTAIREKRNVTLQTISGTGSLRIGGTFLAKHFPNSKAIYLPNPSWPNHAPVFKHSGLEVKQYRYYDPSTCALDEAGMLQDLAKMPENSIVLFHACAHNPTGVDPTAEQWAKLSDLCKQRNLFVYFDMAYQGFATGDIDDDASAVRQFVDDGHNLILSQSFAKNMGLYGERVGALHIICKDEGEAKRVDSQARILIRPMYSNPPIHGARIAHKILTSPELYSEWLKEVKLMADRVITMRHHLFNGLQKEGSSKDWNHIINQIGMFAYSGLNPAQVERITNEFGVYMTKDGRMAMVGLTSKNVGYVAKAIHEVTK